MSPIVTQAQVLQNDDCALAAVSPNPHLTSWMSKIEPRLAELLIQVAQMIATKARRPTILQPAVFLDEKVVVEHAQVTTNTYEKIPVNVVATSSVDVRFQMDGNPRRGDEVLVEMRLSNGHSAAVRGIVHWTEMRGSLHEVGVFLKSAISNAMPRALIDQRRSEERYRCRQSGRLMLGIHRPEGRAIVVNYSHAGLAIRSSVSAVIDDVFSFRWISGSTTKIIHGRILWQIEQNGGFLLGAEVQPGKGIDLAGLTQINTISS